jgi:hypothetical protein
LQLVALTSDGSSEYGTIKPPEFFLFSLETKKERFFAYLHENGDNGHEKSNRQPGSAGFGLTAFSLPWQQICCSN